VRNCPPRKCEIARREETTVTALLREAARDAVKKRTAAPEQAEALRSLVWRLAPRMPARFKTAAQLARFKRTQREFDQVVLDLQLATPMAIQDRNSLVSSRQTIRLEKRPPRGSLRFNDGVRLSESPAPPAPSPQLLARPGGLAARTVHRLAWRSVASNRARAMGCNPSRTVDRHMDSPRTDLGQDRPRFTAPLMSRNNRPGTTPHNAADEQREGDGGLLMILSFKF